MKKNSLWRRVCPSLLARPPSSVPRALRNISSRDLTRKIVRTENRNNNNIYNVYYAAGTTADGLDPGLCGSEENRGFEMGSDLGKFENKIIMLYVISSTVKMALPIYRGC